MEEQVALYEEVAKVVGEEMNKSFTNILQRLANGETGEIVSLAGPEAGSTSDKIDAFFSILNGAEMGLKFKSRVPKGTGGIYFADNIQSSEEVRGSVSIGVNLEF